MENRKCPVCNTIENKFKLEKDNFKMVECVSCSHIYVLNPTDDTSSPFNGNNKIDNYKTRHYQMYKLIKNLYKEKNNINIAEIGSGIGNFAYLVSKDKQINYIGYEPSKGRYDFSKKFNLNTKNELFQPADNYYDAIIIDNVLEHVENPSYIFKIVSKSLKSGGGIYCDCSK
jgi:2-polyprenyl-3-methyl-5-hydroxy-6-metoxy-1,4-benzoquinol methylase